VAEEMRSCPMVAGASEIFEVLAGRVPMAVVSGTPVDELKSIVEQRNLGRYFAEVRGSPPGKAAIIAELVRKYGWMPNRMIMIGDSMTDYEAARATGLGFVGRRSKENGGFPSGTVTLPDLTNLLSTVAGYAPAGKARSGFLAQ